MHISVFYPIFVSVPEFGRRRDSPSLTNEGNPSMSESDRAVLVTGATGSQGGAVARKLLEAGSAVRVLTRTTESHAAQELARLGAEVARGDWDDVDSLVAAMQGARGVFSVQRPDADNSDSERRHGRNLVAAARRAGVRHFLHTSVCEAGRHTEFPRWESGYWYQKYWTDKWDVEECVRGAGFERWTIFKPAFLMDNFAEPKAARMFPHLREGKVLTALTPGTRLQLIAADDVGAFCRAALADPERFDRRSIDLAAEAWTMAEIAEMLAAALRKSVVAEHVSPKEARAAGIFPGWIRTQEWVNEVGYRADIPALAAYGIPLTSFQAWISRHASEIVIES
jgi:uncharacterized protein YbjT (DUF2867 family)